MSSTDMYMENILDYYNNPRNFGDLENANIKNKSFNPLCGDEIEMQLILKGGKIKDVKFKGRGCAISIASTSMLTEKVKYKSIADVKKLKKEDIIEMLNIPISPARLKCALLSLEVLHKCVYNFDK